MIACPSCGHENPSGARFCNGCGAALAITDRGDVRKTVTIVFCDVVGSTELATRHDPEVLRGMMARFYAAVRAPVERHGGTVEKVIGDALVAVFGIPAVHEDDALRAVRAALEMRDAVESLGEVQARIGVNTGDVLARDATPGESLVVGEAVNVAARLEQAAGAGDVLVGDATWALVRHAAHGRRAEPIQAKGTPAPLVAWRLDAVDAGARGHRRRLDLPLVGRDAELGALRWTLERAEAAQTPHLVTILGQPGIGKSRLVTELRSLRDDLVVLTGHCRRTAGATSLEPVLEAVRELLPGDAEQAAVALMPGDPDAAQVAGCLTRPGAGAPDIVWAVSRLLGAMAAARTVVLVIEDLHWADDAVVDLLGRLLGRGHRRALLVCVTARPELAGERPGWGSGPNALSLMLERLDDAQTRRLLRNAGPGLPGDEVDRIIAMAEGNPLFAEHLAALVGEGDPAGGLPRSIQVLLTARLEALPAPARDVMTAASIVGREFPVDAIDALAGRSCAAELEALVEHELLDPTTPGRLQFGHALLQEAAYGLLPKARRADLHLQLADWLEARGASDALIGEQLDRAHEWRVELGADGDAAAALGVRAGERLLAAARTADAMGDPRRARRLLERALAVLPERSAVRAAALVELGAAGWNLLERDEIDTVLRDGMELAAATGARAVELRGRVLRFGSITEGSPEALDTPEILAATEAVLPELEALGDARATATALCTLAWTEATMGRAGDAVTTIRRALALLRENDQDVVWPLSILSWGLVESPTPAGAGDALLALLAAEMGVRPTVRSELLQGRAALALLRGAEDEAWRLFGDARAIEEEIGRDTSMRMQELEGAMLLRSGRLAETADVMRALAARFEEIGIESNAAIARSFVALAEARAGEVGRERATAIAAEAARGGGYEVAARTLTALAELRARAGDADAAVAAGREAVAVAETGDWLLLRADAHLALARALAAAGDPAAAAEAEEAGRRYRDKGFERGVAEAAAVVAAAPRSA
jgi:class 3 adenylate cyclase/tetratricopeptide (TPR) repeat protein